MNNWSTSCKKLSKKRQKNANVRVSTPANTHIHMLPSRRFKISRERLRKMDRKIQVDLDNQHEQVNYGKYR